MFAVAFEDEDNHNSMVTFLLHNVSETDYNHVLTNGKGCEDHL